MDAFSASLMADKREIVFAPTVYKFQTSPRWLRSSSWVNGTWF